MINQSKFVTISLMLRRCLCLLVGLICLLATLTSAAQAQLTPHNGISSMSNIWGVAKSGPNILVVTFTPNKNDADEDYASRSLYLSNDNGQTFRWLNYRTNPSSGLYVWGVTAGPDGNFYLAGDDQRVMGKNYPDIWRVNSTSGALTAMGANLAPARGQLSAPAFDDQGNAWVINSQYNGELVRLSTSNWQVQETIPLRQTTTLDAAMPSQQQSLEWAAGALFINSESSISNIEFMRYKDGQLTKAPSGKYYGMPQLVDGQRIFFTRGISYNGGRTISEGSYWHGSPTNSGNYLASYSRLMRKTSDNFFRFEGLEVNGSTEKINSVLETPNGQLAFYDFSQMLQYEYGDSFYNIYNGPDLFINQGPAPGLKPVGTIAPDTQELIDQANFFRAEAGFPPLLGHSEISKASRNHVAYQMKHFEGHDETPGKEGFTGEGPYQRCLFVGTSCGSEILSMGTFGKWAINSWMTTSFHRNMIGSPAAGYVGGAYAKGNKFWEDVSVMNSSTGQGLTVGPIPFPTGTWHGELEFYNESPDPGARCAGFPSKISKPYGTAVSLYMPAGFKIANLILTEEGTSQSLPGCIIENAFIPDDALKPFTKYNVRAYYNDGSGGENQLINWSFTTTGDNRAPDDGRNGYDNGSGGSGSGNNGSAPDNNDQPTEEDCQASIRLTGKSSRPIKKGLTFDYQSCSNTAYVRFTLTRIKSKRASIKLNEYLGVAKGDGSINLTKKVRRGSYRASLALYDDSGTLDSHKKTFKLR